MFHKIYLRSHIVSNNGNWTEIDKSNVSEASKLTDNCGNKMGHTTNMTHYELI
jgi:uncharacterized protein YfiM (DUF2279 family)